MAQLITLSRAARLVGVKRGTLQQRIRAGELRTFEGELDLSELLRVYPQTKVHDTGMIERADRIVEHALGKVVRDRGNLPDPEVLATRVSALSNELAGNRMKLQRYQGLVDQMQRRLSDLVTLQQQGTQLDVADLKTWFEAALQSAQRPVTLEEDVYATDAFLRLMAAHVHLQKSGHEYFVEGNDSILDAGLRAGFHLDYGCSDGSCGKCMARVRSGIVKPIRSSRFELGEQRLQKGYTLLCCNTAVTDVVIDAPEAHHVNEIEQQRLTAQLRAAQLIDDDLLLLQLRTPTDQRLRFLAGQSATLVMDDDRAEFAIASCPCEEHVLEFHVASADHALARRLFAEARPGMEFGVEGPHGEFVLNENSARSLVFIAWDTGFAPIKSLIEHAMALDSAESIELFWVHTRKQRPYLDNRCRSWADALDNFSYQAMQQDPAMDGDAFVDDFISTISEARPQVKAFDYYLVAPQAVVRHCDRDLQARGVPAAQIRSLGW